MPMSPIKIEDVTIHPEHSLLPPHPALGAAAVLSSVTIEEFCLVLNIQHSLCALVCCLLLFSLRWCGGSTGSFPDLPLLRLPLRLGGFRVCSLRMKQQGHPCQGLWRICLAVGLLAMGCVHIFYGDFHSLDIFFPVGEELGGHPEDMKSKG